MKPTRYISIGLLSFAALLITGCVGYNVGKQESLAAKAEVLSKQHNSLLTHDKGELYYPTSEELDRAYKKSVNDMKRDGWRWVKEAEDCDDLAKKLASEMRHYIARRNKESHGKSIAIVIWKKHLYTPKSHMVVIAYTSVTENKLFEYKGD